MSNETKKGTAMKMPKNLKETVNKNTKADVANLVGFLECELQKYPENPNWGQVGDLKRLRSNLLEALTAFSGIAMHDIENTLEDARK